MRLQAGYQHSLVVATRDLDARGRSLPVKTQVADALGPSSVRAFNPTNGSPAATFGTPFSNDPDILDNSNFRDIWDAVQENNSQALELGDEDGSSHPDWDDQVITGELC